MPRACRSAATPIVKLVTALLAALPLAARTHAVTLSYSFDELLNTPHTSIEFHPYHIGASFTHIDDITLDLAGQATRTTWEVRFSDTGQIVRTEQSDLWLADLYDPPANHALRSFDGSGPFDVSLDLFENGSWDELYTGRFSLRAIPDGIYLGIYTVVLVPETAEVTLTKVTLNITGTPSFPGDANGDGIVDGSDFIQWQTLPGGAAMIDKWRESFGAGGGARAIPEPAAGFLTLLALFAYRKACRRRR
jgi:hypothetical protein